VLEEEVPFDQFGRTASRPPSSASSRVREGERTRIREEFSGKVGELLSGEVQQIERGKIVVMLNKFREAEAIIPIATRITASTSIRATHPRGVEADRGDAERAATHSVAR